MNMNLLLSIVGAVLFFGGIRWLHQFFQARKIAAKTKARQQRLHNRRAKDREGSPQNYVIYSNFPRETKKVRPRFD